MVKQRISLKDVAIHIGDTLVGGSEELTCTVSAEDTVAHEGASYLPAEIVDGAITINGSITRAFIDVDLLNDIFPDDKSLVASIAVICMIGHASRRLLVSTPT